MKDETVPYNKAVPNKDRKKVSDFIKERTGGDLSKVTPELGETAIKSLIGSDTAFCAVPLKVHGPAGTTLRIPLRKSSVPAFATLQQLIM